MTKQANGRPVNAQQAAGLLRMNGAPGGLMYIGHGPWIVLPECPGTWHNTIRAAEGRSRNNKPRGQCICPRALALREADKIKRRGRDRARRIRNSSRQLAGIVEAAAALTGQPDLRAGACNSAMGRKLMDDITTNPLPEGATAAHRRMCMGCPVRTACGGWAVKQEEDSAPWDGMYGALMPHERRALRVDLRALIGQQEQAQQPEAGVAA